MQVCLFPGMVLPLQPGAQKDVLHVLVPSHNIYTACMHTYLQNLEALFAVTRGSCPVLECSPYGVKYSCTADTNHHGSLS